MQILIITAVFHPEPVVSAKLSYDIASALSEMNKVIVISPKPSRPFGFQFTNESLQFSFDHIQVGSFICASASIVGRINESYSFGKRCYRYIVDNHQSIDVIYANTWPLLGQYFAVKAARKYKIPIVIHVQDIYPESLAKKLPFAATVFNSLLMPLDKYVLGKASKMIAISQKMKDYLVKSRKLDNDKISVVPNWQDEESFINYNKQSFHTMGEPFTFMYLGNIGPVAGVEMLIDAFILANLNHSRLIIAGSGTMKMSTMGKAKVYPDFDIKFWEVPEGKVPEIQAQADVMLLPIKKGAASSSVPSKLPAYMFSAKPIIASVDENSDTADAISNASCGWVVRPDDKEALASQMKQTFTLDKETLQELGSNGRSYALMNYSKQNNLPKLVNIIREISKQWSSES